jgi:DNA-binding Lrp family transcriptional regulator
MEQDQEQAAYDASIIAPVLYHETLSNTSKLLYGIIRNLTRKHGYAFAHNSKLAKDLRCSESTIQKCIKELEDEGFIKRDLTYTDKDQSIRKIKLLGDRQNTTWEPSRFLHGTPVENYTHNIQSNKQDNILINNNKSRKRSSKKIDPQHEEASVAFELESLARWNELTRLWFTGENPHGLKGTYRKYFLDLGTEGQESLLNVIRSFGDDTRYLFNVWIGMTFKQDCMNEQFLKEAIENAKEIEKRKTPTKPGQYKKPSYFGNE